MAAGKAKAGGAAPSPGTKGYETMTAVELSRRLAEKPAELGVVIAALRRRIEAREAAVGAWIALDWDQVAREQARVEAIPAGKRGPMWGLPVGIKDIFDTADLPTGYGSPIYAGHRPATDSAAVAELRRAGAVILGKTVTTEFAFRTAGKTRNPHNTAHSPGGSSSGSAAAVADFMVPLSVGSQTGGSVIRPASYCGVVGFKPSFGRIGLFGCRPLAVSYDTAGVFGRTVADAALIGGAICREPSWPRLAAVPGAPRLAVPRIPELKEGEAPTLAALENASKALTKAGASVKDVEPTAPFRRQTEMYNVIAQHEAARDMLPDVEANAAKVSQPYREMVEQGRKVSGADYFKAVADKDRLIADIDALFGGADAVLFPAAPGEAPHLSLNTTGDTPMNRTWTMLRVPCITIPCGRGPKGLPLGMQVIGRPGDDARALSIALWAERHLAGVA